MPDYFLRGKFALVERTSPVLTCISDPVSDLKMIDRLTKILKDALRSNGGLGIALPQLGISLRGFHLASSITRPSKRRFCFNPEIVAKSSEITTMTEGCLSLGGGKEYYKVPRPARISVTYINEHGAVTEEILTGAAARCFQHEFDHLNGILISDGNQKVVVK